MNLFLVVLLVIVRFYLMLKQAAIPVEKVLYEVLGHWRSRALTLPPEVFGTGPDLCVGSVESLTAWY